MLDVCVCTPNNPTPDFLCLPITGHQGIHHIAALPRLQQLDMSEMLCSLPPVSVFPALTALDMSSAVDTIEVRSKGQKSHRKKGKRLNDDRCAILSLVAQCAQLPTAVNSLSAATENCLDDLLHSIGGRQLHL